MLEKKNYQVQTLNRLEEYLQLAAKIGTSAAFNKMPGCTGYIPAPRLRGMPYVCLRVPTGGGKTFMACDALGIAATAFVKREYVVCLWLVPSNAIKDQTLAALRNHGHPYRQAVNSWFKGHVTVMDLSEALYVSRSDIGGSTCIVVSTLAALRVEEPENRKIYSPDTGALQPHFSGLKREQLDRLEKTDDGRVAISLANVLRLHRPAVIMDEAHNARTPLSFETLERFDASCIIEFTATPQTENDPPNEMFASNVLCHVSAAELKAEEMVKLPIHLRCRPNWKEVIAEAVNCRDRLEALAGQEERETAEYLRPIALVQAQHSRKTKETLDVDVVKRCLIEDCKVPEDWIAIATGTKREIDNVDLPARDCDIRYIITKQALREGWDCPFAYVLCSVAETGSARAVEQILGRILRLPKASKKRHVELNRAYAFTSSARFEEAAAGLKDALVNNGFERYESERYIHGSAEQTELPIGEGLFTLIGEEIAEKPDLSSVERELRERVAYDEKAGRLTLTGSASRRDEEALLATVKKPESKKKIRSVCRRSRGESVRGQSPAERGEPFDVPQFSIRVGEQLELFEDQFLEGEWDVSKWNAALSESEYAVPSEDRRLAVVDVSAKGEAEYRFVNELHEQMVLLDLEHPWTVAALANWLDGKIPHPYIRQSQSRVFMYNVVRLLVDDRKLTTEQLTRHRFRLRDAVETKIAEHRRAASEKAYQQALFSPGWAEVEVNHAVCFPFPQEDYDPNRYYDGAWKPQKHYYEPIGEMNGEEVECAQIIDGMPEVRYWVRNLERKPDRAFWLRTATERFYPDFVALLTDGRILVVEYKGEYLYDNPRERQKDAVGKMWADRSGGRCIFVMPKGRDFGMIMAAVRGSVRP